MSTPHTTNEAETSPRNPKAPPWQGECAHLCLHATPSSRGRVGGFRCCRCDVIVRRASLPASLRRSYGYVW